MEAPENPRLPRRLAYAGVGEGVELPAFTFTAPPDVIVRFLAALRDWKPDCAVEVESVAQPDDPMPAQPLWRLWACITVKP